MNKVAACVYGCQLNQQNLRKILQHRELTSPLETYTSTHLVVRLGWIQEMEEKEPTQPKSTTCSSLKEGQGVGGAGRREKEPKGAITKGTSFQGPYLGKRSRPRQFSSL